MVEWSGIAEDLRVAVIVQSWLHNNSITKVYRCVSLGNTYNKLLLLNHRPPRIIIYTHADISIIPTNIDGKHDL